MSTYRPVRCSCGDAICQHWHVTGVANVQGVAFDRRQAVAVAALLNQMSDLSAPEARAIEPDYRNLKHPNGAPMFASNGMMLNPDGSRSIFDDVDH